VKTSRLRLKRLAESAHYNRQLGTFEFPMADLATLADLREENILAKTLPVLRSLVNLKN